MDLREFLRRNRQFLDRGIIGGVPERALRRNRRFPALGGV